MKRKNINFNVNKNECYRLLWDIRCNINILIKIMMKNYKNI